METNETNIVAEGEKPQKKRKLWKWKWKCKISKTNIKIPKYLPIYQFIYQIHFSFKLRWMTVALMTQL